MDNKTKAKRQVNSRWLDALYALRTPLFDRYYRAMRKRMRFPRYYKQELNW